MNLLILLCILSYMVYVSCESACSSHRTCGECIGHASERCVWCLQETKNITRRCQSETFMLNNGNWCKKTSIYNPKHMDMINVINYNLSSTVQFRPQEIKIKARPGVFGYFSMTYMPAKDFPLDVYFLMDYTHTMKNYKNELEKRALDIYDGLRLLTRNVRLGVGSFVEKPGLPYADVIMLNTVYAFKNHLSLTDDMKSFVSVIKNSKFGANCDNPEAGLDALMQVMTCENELGWRNDSRRIIVLATDDTYHSAGDGKMVGAIKPNDMQCHLKGDEYDPDIALTLDYPSVSQINKVAENGKYKIIFAALSRVKTAYEALAKQIMGAKYAELKEESNIMHIIQAAYEESVANVKIVYKAPSYIQLLIDQDCEAIPSVNCKISPQNRSVSIPAKIKSTECPSPGTVAEITINPVGLRDTLTIKFEVECQCECERNDINTLSNECSDNGIKQCGACKCNENRAGDWCQFNCSQVEAMDFSKCMQYQNSSKPCNGHGSCKCGKCDCNENFSGEYCQFDDTSCPGGIENLCSKHGTCKYAQCECIPPWTGEACACNDKLCIGPLSAQACSGRGFCDCGKCKCTNTDEKKGKRQYLGAFCDSCDECAIERCQELKDYAHCNYMKEKYICDKKYDQNANIDVRLGNKTEVVNWPEWGTATKCRTELEDGTFLLFKYAADTETRRLLLMIQNEVELPGKAKIWVAVGSAIAGILLIGLLTAIIWKISIDMYDKREYEKFCQEAKGQGYDVSENILYEGPTQNFVNPGFNQSFD